MGMDTDNYSTDTKKNLNKEFAEDILRGLRQHKKVISSKYLYDSNGCDIFNKITRHKDYYLTACEMEILNNSIENIHSIIGDKPFNLIELGPGEGIKTLVLIDYFLKQQVDFTYMPIDISDKYLQQFKENILLSHPKVKVNLIQSDYTNGFSWLKEYQETRNVVLFLGSSIGNFNSIGAIRFLSRLSKALKQDDLFLIGFDLKKPIPILLKAYDDSDGLTRDFNMNILRRINNELAAEFDLNRFYHHATYNVYSGAMESFIISVCAQTVPIHSLKQTISFKPYEAIHLEYSHKYLSSQIKDLAKRSGFEIVKEFQDSKKYFVDSFWRVTK